MPPKKRKASDAASASQPTKRITRSSTNADLPVTQTPAASQRADPKARKPTPKARPSSKTKETKDFSNERPGTKSEPQAHPDDSEPATYEILSITSDLVKNPIQCHTYTPPTKSTTSTLVFTHGAGGTLSAPAVVNFCAGFSRTSPITAFKGSMNLASRVKSFLACIQHFPWGKKLVLGGRSMGARAAVMAALETAEDEVELVLVSYPLKGPKDVRSQILLDLPGIVKVLFVVGDKDEMCPLEMLEEVRGRMKARSQVVVVRGADHGMRTKPARAERECGEETGRLAAEWLAGNVEEEVTYVGEEG